MRSTNTAFRADTRQLLRNVLDIDYEARKVIMKGRTGAIPLLDFFAAFPTPSHEMLGMRSQSPI